MIYILNRNLKNKKKVNIALNDIFGLGKHLSKQICDQLGLSSQLKLKQLNNIQLELLIQMINQNYITSSQLKRNNTKNIQRLIRIASYRGFRHTEGLSVRGQRTHGNAQTCRKLKFNISKK